MLAGLVGTWGYKAGATGTVTVPKGAVVLQIAADGGGTVTIFGGDAIPVPTDGPLVIRFQHELVQSKNNVATAGSQDIVFAGTSTYFVEFVKSGST